jgi:hypothetical protein
MMYVVYYTSTGEAFSIGTVLAEPMPDYFTVSILDSVSAELLLQGKGIWNPDTLKVDLQPEDLWLKPQNIDEYEL